MLVNASVATFALRKHLRAPGSEGATTEAPVPWTVVLVHLALLAGVVLLAHHPAAFLGLFLMFLGFTQAYERHRSPLIIKEALLVAFFLAGLVVLGGLQGWWLQPIVSSLEPLALFFGALGLTAVIANAPNPAGVALLKRGFEDESIGAGGLLLGALGPTAVAAAAFLLI